MADETDLLNAALGKCGQAPITAITDGTPNANWCKTFYVPIRQAMLRSAVWQFAQDRAILASDPTAPAFEYAFRYAISPLILRIKEYNGDLITPQMSPFTASPAYWMNVAGRYVIESGYLLTNDAQVSITYIKDEPNPAKWDPLFYQLVVSALAGDLARAINHDVALGTTLMKEAIDIWLPFAAAVGGQEHTILPYRTDDLLFGR
jgi:hypothetical protein